MIGESREPRFSLAWYLDSREEEKALIILTYACNRKRRGEKQYISRKALDSTNYGQTKKE